MVYLASSPRSDCGGIVACMVSSISCCAFASNLLIEAVFCDDMCC
ncbi:hypothetical protein APHNP_1174 [Anaplasma phagocytophilum str. ApNP]|uniref:Uncharacterized protein n=1 Tax=Anaplasma phagocytophilum str. ApNP TaxID=1359153 RepID=A0A0F3NJ97_ANAPH|nr:hypothetical protein APHNP_1174 [Anaplasma phagocytophilum str. ApNP]